jgi:Icc-related predicted phosphoesterase
MKIVCTADMHGYLPTIPRCDLLLIAGDICPAHNHGLEFQREWLDTVFRRWLMKDVPAEEIVAVWGNHDLIAETRREEGGKTLYRHIGPPSLPIPFLTDRMYEYNGLKIWGMPWQLPFSEGWAFNLPEPALKEKCALIPRDVDVIVSHGPPYGMGDMTFDGRPAGSRSLRWTVGHHDARLVVCGHIHEDYGQWPLARAGEPTGRLVVNASHVDLRYRPVNPPVEIEL